MTERRQNGNLVTVYFFQYQSDIQNCVDAAMREWTDACNSSSGQKLNFVSSSWPAACCVRIRFSDDVEDFKVPNVTTDGKSPAITRREGSSKSSCDGLYCMPASGSNQAQTVRILINNSPTFKGGNIGSYPKNFFTTNMGELGGVAVDALYTMQGKGYKYYDFCSVIKHEFGHIFGFSDDGGGAPEIDDDCKDETSLMAWEVKPETSSWQTKQISESDKCRFKKLYCCAQTVMSIEDIEVKGSGSLCDGSNESIDVAIFDMIGNLLFVHRAPCDETPSKLIAGVQFDPGLYVAVASRNGRSITFKVLATP